LIVNPGAGPADNDLASRLKACCSIPRIRALSQKQHKRLGQMLIEAGLITPEVLDRAIVEQKKSGQFLGAFLVSQKLVTEKQLLEVLQSQLGLPVVDLATIAVDEAAVGRVKEEMAKRHCALPLEIEGRSTLVVAMSDPLNVAALEDLRFHSGLFIRPMLASGSAIMEAIERFYHLDRSVDQVVRELVADEDQVIIRAVEEHEDLSVEQPEMQDSDSRPIVVLSNWLLKKAVEERASDIHIEPQDRELVIRFRVDGLLREVQRFPKWTQGALVSRLKVLSNLDIAEKRVPQDGRLRVEIDDRRVDMRVSTLPITGGEKLVMRIADQARQVDMKDLGFNPRDRERFCEWLSRPQGIILVTGPTGSGKSTLLYSGLKQVQDVTKNLVTIEDPVEVSLQGINQVQVDEKAKKTFPGALRAILRQDPDVIMVGEIRDKETAQIAFRASVTGHLVLSTVHTNDAAGAVTRLIDLGLEPFMVASALIGVVSMRLVRVICPKCTETYTEDAAHLNRFTSNPQGGSVTLRRGRGCPNCHGSGYVGRTGIFELLEVDANVRALVFQNAPDTAIRQAAAANGLVSMGEDGLRKVLDGITTLEEVARVVYIPDQSGKVCPSCRTVLASDFDYCPSCGSFAGDHCESCRRRLTGEFAHCPYCGTATRHAPARKKARTLGLGADPEDEERLLDSNRGEEDGPLRRAS